MSIEIKQIDYITSTELEQLLDYSIPYYHLPQLMGAKSGSYAIFNLNDEVIQANNDYIEMLMRKGYYDYDSRITSIRNENEVIHLIRALYPDKEKNDILIYIN